MLLQDQSIKDFAALTASDAPVPGGGSVSAMCAAISSALTQMVAGLTAGKKGYETETEKMTEIVNTMPKNTAEFLDGIDRDSEAFDRVMNAFRMPKSTNEEKAVRRQKINEATVYAAEVPMNLAREAVKLFPVIDYVSSSGNKNALSDIAVATMILRTAVRGALFNVRINLASLPESEYKSSLSAEVIDLEKLADEQEKSILSNINL